MTDIGFDKTRYSNIIFVLKIFCTIDILFNTLFCLTDHFENVFLSHVYTTSWTVKYNYESEYH